MNANVAEMNNSLLALGDDAKDYQAGTIAWNDGARGVYGKKVSCWGRNITDARIEAKDGGFCPYVRPHNLREKLAVVDAKYILMVDKDGASVTLQTVLNEMDDRAKYMGLTSADPKVKENEKVVYRVQNAWVPLAKGQTEREIVPTHYSYQTMDKENPCNLMVLGSAQGTFVHTDGVGQKKLLAHSVDGDGEVNTHFFTAEPTDTLVGQAMDKEDDAPAPKKAKAVEMGVQGMGARANCFVVASIPLKQKEHVTRGLSGYSCAGDDAPVYRSLGAASESRSARVSVSEDVYGKADKVAIKAVRDETQPIVVTILLYNTVTTDADVDSHRIKTADVGMAVADMERIYNLARKHGGAVCYIDELPAMLHKLSEEDMATIHKKVATDPPFDPMVPRKDAVAMF